jgi:hypothetical protein
MVIDMNPAFIPLLVKLADNGLSLLFDSLKRRNKEKVEEVIGKEIPVHPTEAEIVELKKLEVEKEDELLAEITEFDVLADGDLSLSDQQWLFLLDVAKLIEYARVNNYKLTGGELKRTVEQQKLYIKQGRSTTMNSYHLKALAIDFNIFPDGNYDPSVDAGRLLGDYWVSLNPELNVWGGNWKSFKDAPHFQRTVK